MFGNYPRKLDDKNRVIIPAKLKSKLSKICYITIDFDNVLTLRDKDAFNHWSNDLMNLNTLDSNARKFARLLLGRTYEVEIDKQGRIAIPKETISTSNLTKDVVFVGVGNKIEIHSKSAFNQLQQSVSKDDSLESLAKKLIKDGAKL